MKNDHMAKITPTADRIERTATVYDTVTGSEPDALAKSIVNDLSSAVQAGKTVEQAAEERGIDLQKYSAPVRRTVLELLAANYMPPDMVREIIRAGRNKLILEGVTATGEEELARKRLALEAMKQAASDPEIGLNQPPQTTINIDMRDVVDLAKNLDIPDFMKPPEGLDE